MNRSIIIFLMGLLILTSSAMATTRIVPDSYGSIQLAISACSNGDKVLVSSGTYSENIDFLGKDILVCSESGAASTTIEASNVNEPTVRMDSNEPKGAEIRGFTITGSNYCGIYCNGSSPTITNNIIENNSSNYEDNGAGIDLNYTTTSYIRNNILRDNTADTYGAAIHTNNCTNDTICYNLLYDNYGFTEIRCLRTTAAVYNNTIDVGGSRCHGISNQLSGTLDCRNNIIVNVPDAFAGVYAYGVYAANGGYLTVAYSDFYNNAHGMSGGSGITAGFGNFTSDPEFWGIPAGTPEEYDILPPPFSPCVDAGDPDAFFNDYDGTRNDLGWRSWNYDLPVLFVPTQYASIQAAIDAAVDDDMIFVLPGIYSENIDFLGKDLLIRSELGAANTTIQAANANQPTVRMDSNEPKGAEIRGFTITGSNYCGIYCNGSSPTITNNIIENNSSNNANNGAGIDLNSTTSSIIRNNIMCGNTAYTYGSAIQTESCTNDTICYNLLYDNYGFTEIRCLNTTAAIYNNTIDVDSSRCHGISNQLSGTLDCRNNIIVNVPDAFSGVYAYGVYAANGGNLTVAYSDFYNNAHGMSGGPGVTVGSGNITDDPLFTGLYDLDNGSPCIDTGDPDAFFNDPDCSRNDMGWKPYIAGGPKQVEEELLVEIPEDYKLFKNYPNPFNASTTIEYNIPNASMVALDVYDILGRHVANLVNSYQNAGVQTVIWNAGDMTSGTYFYRVQSEDLNETRKMLLLK